MRLWNLCKKENFKPEIKSIIKNLEDELYQLENKQAKGAKLRDKIKWELEKEYAQSNNIWIIYWW